MRSFPLLETGEDVSFPCWSPLRLLGSACIHACSQKTVRREKISNCATKKSPQSAFHLHFKDNGQNSSHFLKVLNRHPHPLIVIKFCLIFSFSRLSSPSLWCNSSLSHSLPNHLSLSLGSSEPLTPDPGQVHQRVRSLAGETGREEGWNVCYWGMPASSSGHGYSLHCRCHGNWTRRQREQTAESRWDGTLCSVIWL